MAMHQKHHTFSGWKNYEPSRVQFPSDTLPTHLPILQKENGFFVCYDAQGPTKIVVPPAPMQRKFVHKLLLTCVPMFVFFNLIKIGFQHDAFSIALIFLAGFFLYVGLSNLYAALNALVESQSLLIADNKLIIRKDQLFYPIEYEIPLHGIWSIEVIRAEGATDPEDENLIPRVRIGKFMVPVYEYARGDQASAFVTALREMVGLGRS